MVGDAALMSGLSLEALNDIGQRGTQMLIVLNDNEMSISPTVGAFSHYLSQIKLSPAWQQSRTVYDRVVERLPLVGGTALELSQRLRKSVVNFAQPGQLFEDLGITYIGVVPGHDLVALERMFAQALGLREPVIVHVRTQKGRGYQPAEADQVGFHGAALPPMTDAYEVRSNGTNGATAATNGAAGADDGGLAGRSLQDPGMADDATPALALPDAPQKAPNYTAHFSAELVELAATDRRIVAITAGMPTGTGLNRFQARFPDRFFDVGIAEQHAVAMATGLAMGGLRPVVAIYSTFLQRAFDQTVHDVLPERPAGPPRGRPGRPRRRGRHQSPGDVHPARPAPDPEPGHRLAEGRAGAPVAAPDRARPGPPVRAPLSARPGLPICRRSSRRSCRSVAARRCAKDRMS